MQLIIISHPVILENEVAYLDRLTGEGLQTIHLRKPGATEGEIIQLIEQMDENLRKRVMIHSHFSIARQYGLKGIHYTWKDKHLPVKADELQKSMSVHSIEETERPQYRDLDYYFLSPIFPSISKPGYEKAFDFDFLKTKLSDNKLCNKVFALGGIVPDRIQTCHQLGFHGVAVLGYFWEPLVNGKEDLAFERFRKLNVACRYFSKKKECKKK